jgi:DNA-binding response OmpR family regulator
VRVLIVNDDPDIAESLHAVIERQFPGVFVTVCLSGAAGLQLLRDDPTYAVVLCDPNVRGLDARAFLAEARRIAPQAKHLVMAATSQAKAREVAGEVGADALLLKPFDMQSLEQALGVLLGGAAPRRPGTPPA